MSDIDGGPDWWRAADGTWHPRTAARAQGTAPGTTTPRVAPGHLERPHFERRDAARVRCEECRGTMRRSAAVCPTCGTASRAIKDRSIAIICAVFFSFVTWSYTYKRNWAKFWTGLLLSAVGALVFIVAPVGIVLVVAVWAWAVVDAVAKPAQYYLRYPEPPYG